MKSLIADTFRFLGDFLPYFTAIVIALTVIAFVVIVVVAVKNRKKSNDYVPDEIDRTVDEAAQKKEQESEEPEVCATEEQQSAEENAEDEDEDEEITFEAEDVEPEDKSDEEGSENAKEQKDGSKRKVTYRILYDKESKTWEIRKDNAKRVIRRVKTKKEALEIAQELSKNQDVNLVVHKKDGKFQKKENWSRNISSSDSENK